MNILGLGALLLKLAPHVINLVMVAEAAKGAKTGPEKKAAVLEGAKALLDGTNAAAKIKEIDEPAEQAKVLDVVDKGTDLVVAVFNASGLFRKGPEPILGAGASGGQ
jgi:hypothetical protein